MTESLDLSAGAYVKGISLIDASGKPIRLLPGTTWFHLVPTDRQIVVQ